jgi:hypothetical protein
MFLVGHLHTVVEGDCAALKRLLSTDVMPLLLPDVCDTHAPLYDRLPSWQPRGLSEWLLYSHMLGDWIVHFGPVIARGRGRRGWAYQRMAVASALYDEFFVAACHAGLRPDSKPSDSRRGFSHTLVEYSIDTVVTRMRVYDSVFAPLRAALLDQLTLNAMLAHCASFGLSSHIDVAALGAKVECFADRIARSSAPDDLARWAGVRKFGLERCAESAKFVGTYINAVTDALRGDDILDTLEICCERVRASGRGIRDEFFA